MSRWATITSILRLSRAPPLNSDRNSTTPMVSTLTRHLSVDLTVPAQAPMHGSYSHLRFAENWKVSPKAQYELGQCDAIVSAICEMPLRPEHHEQLLRVSLIKGAQATTAIEGNTLSEDEIQRVVEGQSLPPSKEYQEIEVRNVRMATTPRTRTPSGS